MRIVMTYHYFWPHRGGIENTAGGLAREFVKLGHEVTVITSDIGEGGAKRPAHEKVEGIDVIRLPGIHLPGRILALRGLWKTLKGTEGDVWHAHHPSPFVADRFIFQCKKRHLPTVLSYHADAADEGMVDSLLASGYYRTLGNRMLSSANEIMVHSKSYMETSPWLLPHRKKVSIIPAGIRPEEFSHADSKKFRRLFKLKEKKVVCSLGRLVPYKGYEYLIRALPLLGKDWVFLLGGSGPEESRLKKLALDLGLKDSVIFAGRINEAEKKDFYAAADVFCLPSISRGEAFGVSILEAMAVGRPAVVSDIPGPRDIKGAITVRPRSPEALAKAITDADGIRAKLDPEYDIRNAAKKVLGVYERLL
ncbi:MAG: glycosyltransferase [Candidatus Aenigmatarchaeota archaeon]